MGDLEILKPGLYSTVQDGGRYGYQSYGIPVSGAMDRYAYRMGNYILGNDSEAAALEITLTGPEILFKSSVEIAITGGDFSPSLNGEPVQMWRALSTAPGDILSFGEVRSGARSYIAFAGGIDVPSVMGSRSTYARGGIGGYRGRPLIEGDVIDVLGRDGGNKEVSKYLNPEYIPKYDKYIELRVVMGPQQDMFTDKGIDNFLGSEFICTAQIDRMGYRLSGPVVESIAGTDIISDGVAFGAVQITSSGDPIIMMADRQTVGGYAKIACVVWADIHKVAQAKTGDRLTFKEISIQEAQKVDYMGRYIV